jgi:hypothetical protein
LTRRRSVGISGKKGLLFQQFPRAPLRFFPERRQPFIRIQLTYAFFRLLEVAEDGELETGVRDAAHDALQNMQKIKAA